MLFGGTRGGFGPGEQLIRRDGPLPHLLVLVRVIGDPLIEFASMRQEERDIEGAPFVEDRGGPVQVRSFLGIGSPCCAFAQVELELGRARSLSHLLPLHTLSEQFEPTL